MKILCVSFSHLNCNSGIHIFNIMNELTNQAMECAVCVPHNKESVNEIGRPKFKVFNYSEYLADNSQFVPDVIYAWTPREIVRKYISKLREVLKCPYVVHLEDNESHITMKMLGLEDLKDLDKIKVTDSIPDHLSHPIKHKEFLNESKGLSTLIDKLLEFKPQGKPGITFWPAYDDAFAQEFSPEENMLLRKDLGITSDENIIVYTGNVHPANAKEVYSLYLAVYILNRKGSPIRLIRTGNDGVNLIEKQVGMINDYCINLGFQKRSMLPKLLAIADILVQPGTSDHFNDYRFPSKLPEYLVAGKPVVLPKSNIGRFLTSYDNCILLNKGDALEIAEKVEELINKKELREKIGKNGKAFARKYFSWEKAASDLIKLFKKVCKEELPGVDQREINKVDNLYFNNYKTEPISYATVRDFCDSLDNLNDLATINRDLKDCQRPWILKAILGSIPKGAKLLEIGGGEPFVADKLIQLGYDVTIVDPYDGTGNGPEAYTYFVKRFPDVKIIREFFTDQMPMLEDASYDCIYSISVLEHIPFNDIPGVFDGIRKYLKNGGISLHAVDHVLKGNGDRQHHEKLELMVKEMGYEPEELSAVLTESKEDVETYFLSAYAHNLWRGSIPYDDFPMRQCISVQLCATKQ